MSTLLEKISLKIDTKTVLLYSSGFLVSLLAGAVLTKLPLNIYIILICSLVFLILAYYKLGGNQLPKRAMSVKVVRIKC